MRGSGIGLFKTLSGHFLQKQIKTVIILSDNSCPQPGFEPYILFLVYLTMLLVTYNRGGNL
jgi:hypothetical protein